MFSDHQPHFILLNNNINVIDLPPVFEVVWLA